MSIEQPFDPDQHRRDAMTEGSGFSDYLADAHLSDEAFPGTEEPPRSPKPPRKPRHSHRGGRSYPEKSGRDISREMANQEAAEQAPVPLEERREASARGRLAIEAALDEAFGKDRHIAALEAKVNAMIPIDPDDVAGSEAARERHLNALLRTYFDSKK